MNNNIYENLKKVLCIGIKDNKLKHYQAMTSRTLEDDLKYKNKEESLVSSLSTLVGFTNSGYDKKKIAEFKKNLGITNIYDERNFFTKLFMRDYESKNNESYCFRNGIDVRNLFRYFASEKLKSDLEFAKTIVTLDGKYLKGMSEEVRSNKEIVSIAVKNDTSKDIDSFINSCGDALEDSSIALSYFQKRKENNSFLKAYEVYNTIFKKDENDNFPNEIFSNNVQNKWLDNNFLAGLAKLNIDFIEYIVDGKISLTPDSVRKKIKEKGKYYE